jgi:hypothetical protein
MVHEGPSDRRLTFEGENPIVGTAGQFMNTMSTLEYNTPTLTQEYEYVGEVLLMSMSTQVRRDS